MPKQGKPGKLNGTCINCGVELYTFDVRFFQGVMVCPTCCRIAERKAKQAKDELQMIYNVYVDMLRVALIRKELHLPQLPTDNSMPMVELKKAIEQQLGAQNANCSTERTASQDPMQALRMGKQHPHGKVSGG